MTEKALSTLGLAYKAGRVVYGVESIRHEAGRCAGLLVAEDAGAAAVREIEFLAAKTGIPIARAPYSKETVGRALGKQVCAVVAVTDKRLYQLIVES